LQPVAFINRKGKDYESDDDYLHCQVGKRVGDPAPEAHPAEKWIKKRSTNTPAQAKEAQMDLRSDPPSTGM
jgi:hypothetical protein